MLEVRATDRFRKRFQELPLEIRKKFDKQLALFQKNPLHPSLHTEKLRPKHHNLWSFRLDLDYRVVFQFVDGETAVLMAVGPHARIYRF